MMKSLRRPPSIALAVMVFFLWLLWAGKAPATPAQKSAAIPMSLGPWIGTSMAVDKRSMEILETDDISLVEYHLGQEPPVWFARVAGFGSRATFHPPELCYVGSHFEVLDRRPLTVMSNGKARNVMRLVISQGRERFETWYWFTAGQNVTSNYYQQQIWLLLDAMHHRPMSGTLVRISTPLDEPESAHRRLLAFVTSWDTTNSETHTHHGS